jgi:hypothetical protein
MVIKQKGNKMIPTTSVYLNNKKECNNFIPSETMGLDKILRVGDVIHFWQRGYDESDDEYTGIVEEINGSWIKLKGIKIPKRKGMLSENSPDKCMDMWYNSSFFSIIDILDKNDITEW